MCKRPIYIDNPYYGAPNLLHSGLSRSECRRKFGNASIYRNTAFLHDTQNSRIPVPCGDCAECYALRQSYIAERLQLGSLVYDYWLITLTYKDKFLPRIDIGDYTHAYADYSDIQKMFKRIRKSGALPDNFSYFVASEYGGQFHRPHFHIVLALPKRKWKTNERFHYDAYLWKLFLDEWKINTSKSTKFPVWESLLDYKVNPRTKKSTYDCRPVIDYVDKDGVFHYGALEVGFYLTKYVTKFDNWINRKKYALRLNYSPEEFRDYWNILRPKWRFSKGFLYEKYSVRSDGIRKLHSAIYDRMREYIRWSIDINPEKGFRFFIPVKNKQIPLDPYLRNIFCTPYDMIDMFFSKPSGFSPVDNTPPVLSPSEARAEVHRDTARDERLKRIRRIISDRNSSEYSSFFDRCQSMDIEPVDLDSFVDYDPCAFDVPEDFAQYFQGSLGLDFQRSSEKYFRHVRKC